jgi:hypothetical protein
MMLWLKSFLYTLLILIGVAVVFGLVVLVFSLPGWIQLGLIGALVIFALTAFVHNALVEGKLR